MTHAELIQQQVDAYNERNLEKFVSCFADDIQVFNYGENAASINGKEALIKSYQSVFENSPELQAKIINRIVFDNKVIDHEHVTGRVGIEFIDLVVIYELKDEKVHQVTYIKKQV